GGVRRAGPALAAARARDAALPPVPRRDPVRRGLLGEALRLLGGGGEGALLAGPAGRDPPRRGALLLPGRRQADVHRRTGAGGAGAAVADAGDGGHPVRARDRGAGGVSEATGDGRPASRRASVLIGGSIAPPITPQPCPRSEWPRSA